MEEFLNASLAGGEEKTSPVLFRGIRDVVVQSLDNDSGWVSECDEGVPEGGWDMSLWEAPLGEFPSRRCDVPERGPFKEVIRLLISHGRSRSSNGWETREQLTDVGEESLLEIVYAPVQGIQCQREGGVAPQWLDTYDCQIPDVGEESLLRFENVPV